MRFRTQIVPYSEEAYSKLPRIRRVFREDNICYEKNAVVDKHDFLVDTDYEIKEGARVEDSVLKQDFLLLSILPTPDRKGRIINVASRYGACERLHDLLVHPEIVNAIWLDWSKTRKKGDTDLRYPWLQALFKVELIHWPCPEEYQRPELRHIHWMPQFGRCEEDRSDI